MDDLAKIYQAYFHDVYLMYITAYDTVLGSLSDTNVILVSGVKEVYYEKRDGREAELIWSTYERQTDPLESFITLPRLFLNYYLLLAFAAAAILSTAALIARWRGWLFLQGIFLRLMFLPLCYFSAHFFIMFDSAVTYTAQRDFLFIWATAAMLYIASLCVLALRRR